MFRTLDLLDPQKPQEWRVLILDGHDVYDAQVAAVCRDDLRPRRDRDGVVGLTGVATVTVEESVAVKAMRTRQFCHSVRGPDERRLYRASDDEALSGA
jgi:hypothetical protein